MLKLLKYKLLLISFLILIGCVSDKEVTNITYFGGKIINPKSNIVFLYKDGKLLDSAKLSEKNKFIFEFDSLKVGLYTFEHGPEIQFAFLESNDSLLLRLNTWDFDESLVFSGKGAERNNLLINLFLQKEKEDKLVYNYYPLNDSIFNLKIDSLLQSKKLLYNHFKEEVTEVSPLYDKYVNAAIYLPLYKKKEAYPYRHQKALKLDTYPLISPVFYKYRKSIDINDEDLYNFYAQYEYVRTYLYHLSYEKFLIDNKSGHMVVNFIETVVKNIKNSKLKNRLMNEGLWDVFLDENISNTEKNKIKELFFNNCNDKKLTNNITQLVKASEKPKVGDEFPIIEGYNFSNKKIIINTFTNGKNTVVYFWPKELRQLENLAKRVNYLEKHYPKIQFIGINSKNIGYNWKSYIKSKKFNPKNQFRLDRKSIKNDWLFIDYSRAILVDENGIILNGFTHLSSRRFEHQLKKFKKN